MIFLRNLLLGCLWLLTTAGWGGALAAQPIGQVSLLQGRADVTRGSAPAQPLTRGESLFETDVVRTKSASRLEIELRDGSRLTLDENTRLAMRRYAVEAEPEGVFEVLRGRLRSFVGEAFSSRRESFRVRTPTAILGVQGTDFTVQAQTLSTRVEVFAGLVSVRNVDPAIIGSVLLRANQFSVVPRGAPPTPPAGGGTRQGKGSGSGSDLRSDGLQNDDPLSLTPGTGMPGGLALPPVPNPPRP